MFARRRGHSPDDAQDLTQGFSFHLLEQRALASVDRLKGKFRSFLLASFQNHLSDQSDCARRNRLRQEYATEGKTATFQASDVFLDPVNSRVPRAYEEVAGRLHVSTGAVKTLIHRLRRRHTALLREEVGRMVPDPAEIDEKIRALCEALIASGGRLRR
jgi:RNA polymerase sigma-70 factor (ECF subfamily)